MCMNVWLPTVLLRPNFKAPRVFCVNLNEYYSLHFNMILWARFQTNFHSLEFGSCLKIIYYYYSWWKAPFSPKKIGVFSHVSSKGGCPHQRPQGLGGSLVHHRLENTFCFVNPKTSSTICYAWWMTNWKWSRYVIFEGSNNLLGGGRKGGSSKA